MADWTASRPATIDRWGGRLAREIGFTGVLYFCVTGIGLFASGQLPFTIILGTWPGVNLLAVVAIGAGISLLYALTYATIGATIRRPGADYVLASRILSPSLAFAASWSFVIFGALFAGSLVAWIAQTVIPSFVQTFGIIGNNANYLNLASTLATPQVVALIGTSIVVAAFGMTALPPRTVETIFQIGVLAALVGFFILFVQFGLATADAFPAAWDRFMGVAGYDSRVDLAKSLGMALRTDGRSVLAAGSIAGVCMFFGSIFPSIAASEVKRPGKNLLWGSWAAIAIAWLVITLAVLFLQRLVPVEWLSAESYLALHLEAGQAMPWLVFYAAILNPAPWLIFLLGFICVFSLVNLLQLYLFVTSRVILAWAEDGLLPPVYTYVQPRMRSPLVPVFFVAVIALLGMVFFTRQTGSQPFLPFIFYMAVPQVIPVLAALLFPFVRPDWFSQASGFARWKIGPVPVMSLAAMGSLVYLVWLIVLIFIHPLNGVNSAQGFLLAPALVFLTGYFWYQIRRRNRQGDDPSRCDPFKTLPEDHTDAEIE